MNLAKLHFQQVNAGSVSLATKETVTRPVQERVANPQSTIYFPRLTLVNTQGAFGVSEVDAQIVYRQAVGVTTVDVLIRLTNNGTLGVVVNWVVNTFAP